MERELEVKYKNGTLLLDEEDKEFFISLGVSKVKIKFVCDFIEICKEHKISIKKVQKIASVQKVPLEVALGIFLSLGRLNSKQKSQAS